MAKRGFGTIGAIFGEDHLRMIAAQNGQIGAGDTEETTVTQRLNCSIDENAAGTVGIEINDIELMVLRTPILVHQHRSISVVEETMRENAWLGTTRSDVMLL